MTPGSDPSSWTISTQSGNGADDATTYDSGAGHWQTVGQNVSVGEDCLTVIFSDLEFLPWDNPDNLISAEAETVMRRVKNNMLGLLFLIGVPANVINMAVFYRQGLKDRINMCLFTLSLLDGLYLAMQFLHHGEQLYLQFTTQETFGPLATFLTNLGLVVLVTPLFYMSSMLSAIIATERCLCIYNPLKFQRLLRTRTLLVFIILISVLIFGLFLFASFRYRLGCVHDPVSGIVMITGVEGEVYKHHREVIDVLESYVFGVGLPMVAMTVVTLTTILTVVKLRQALALRSEMSTSISLREVALTKMLVGNSVLFIINTSPTAVYRFSWQFLPQMSAGGRNQNFFLASIWLGDLFTFINATFNIVIYYVMGSHYRKTFWMLFGRQTQTGKMSQIEK